MRYLKAIRMMWSAVRDHQRGTIGDDEPKARVNAARAVIGRQAIP